MDIAVHPKLSNGYSWFASDVTAAMLVYRTMVEEVFWEFGSIIMQNLSDILPLFCTRECNPRIAICPLNS